MSELKDEGEVLGLSWGYVNGVGVVARQSPKPFRRCQSWHPLLRFSLGTRLLRQLPQMPRQPTAASFPSPSLCSLAPVAPPSLRTSVRPGYLGGVRSMVYFLPLPECLSTPSHVTKTFGTCLPVRATRRTTRLRRRCAGTMMERDGINSATRTTNHKAPYELASSSNWGVYASWYSSQSIAVCSRATGRH